MPKNHLVLYLKSVYRKKTEQSESETKKNWTKTDPIRGSNVHCPSVQYDIYVCVKCIFSSNQIVQKISFSLCFWAPDPLIDKFY